MPSRATDAADGGAERSGTRFTYLLVNHVPLLPGSEPGRVRLGDLWFEDLRAQAEALAAEGGRLVVATPFGGGSQEGSFSTREVDLAGLPFDYVALPYASDLATFARCLPRLRARLAELIARADVAHIALGGHPIPPGILAWSAAKRAGVPRILAFDGSDEVERRWQAVRAGSRLKWPLRFGFAAHFSAFCARAIRGADLVFAHNASIPRRYVSAWGTHCHVFPRSFVTDDLVLSEGAVSERATRLRGADPLVLAVVGRQVPMKGTDQVLRALAAARRSGARLRLLVIGDGDALDEYRRLAFQLGLAEEVEFLGSVPYGERLFSLWDRAHLTVVTNLTAEISRNVLLSMARATPLVMYENAGTDALLPQGVTTLVPRGDEQALSAVFLRAWREREPFAAQLALGRSFAATTTLEACHRRRAKLAAELVAKTRPLRVTPASR